MFDNKVICITGGTGSFGKYATNFLEQNYKPKKIIIFSRDEFKQFEMRQKFNGEHMRYFLGDVRDFGGGILGRFGEDKGGIRDKQITRGILEKFPRPGNPGNMSGGGD